MILSRIALLHMMSSHLIVCCYTQYCPTSRWCDGVVSRYIGTRDFVLHHAVFITHDLGPHCIVIVARDVNPRYSTAAAHKINSRYVIADSHDVVLFHISLTLLSRARRPHGWLSRAIASGVIPHRAVLHDIIPRRAGGYCIISHCIAVHDVVPHCIVHTMLSRDALLPMHTVLSCITLVHIVLSHLR